MVSTSSSCVLAATALLLCWTSLYVEGVRFQVNGSEFFTTATLNISDVVTFDEPEANGLICLSELTISLANLETGDWYLHPDQETTAGANRLYTAGRRGWSRTRDVTSDDHQQVILRRASAANNHPETPKEGVFTCYIAGDNNPVRSLSILYPISSVNASIVVISARDGEFRVQCSSTGGRALSMTVTGPGGYSSDLTNNIQPVGTQNRTGSDEYSATTSDTITGGSDGDEYECTVTSSTSDTGSVQLRVADAPIIESLEITAADTVRVVWSGPTGGAPVTGYIIHYTGSSGSTGTGAAGAGSTSADITVPFTDGETYTISVEARSEHLSGVSEERTLILEPPPATPEGLMLGTVDSTSVTVSWEAVDDADRYTVTFTRATGDDQQGVCPGGTHSASVLVDAPSTTASIDIGQNVEKDVSNMLRAYSTYFVTVVAMNGGGSSAESEQILVLTPQIGAAIPPDSVMATVDSSTEISVQWNTVGDPCRARNGNITSYRVQYTAQSDGMVQTNQTEDREITLTGLIPFTTYSIEVAAVNVEGDVGVYSEPQYAVTEEDVPGPVGDISSVSSFFMITITWEEPEMPNGIITNYEVVYGPSAFPQFTTEDVTTEPTFTTPKDLERGTEYTFTVTAQTSAGPGEPTTATISTLDRPPAVEGVRVDSLSGTSVNVLWDALVIPGHPIDSYTVVYSPVSQRRKRQEEEEEMVFPGTVTSAVITGLDSSFNYQFQVFATVIANGQTLEGEGSSVVTNMNVSPESENQSNPAPIIAGVVIGIVGVAVGVSGLIAAVVMYRRRRAVSLKTEVVSTGYNVAYGLSESRDRTESKGEYEVPDFMPPSPPETTTEEPVYEGIY